MIFTLLQPLFISVIALLLIYKICSIPKVNKFINDPKKKPIFRAMGFIISTFAIISLFRGVYVFREEQKRNEKIKMENNKIYIENSLKQLEGNLILASSSSADMNNLKETTSIPMGRFDYYLLEKIVDLNFDKTVREAIIVNINDLDTANRFFDRIQGAPSLEAKKNWLDDVDRKVLPRIIQDSILLIKELKKEREKLN